MPIPGPLLEITLIDSTKEYYALSGDSFLIKVKRNSQGLFDGADPEEFLPEKQRMASFEILNKEGLKFEWLEEQYPFTSLLSRQKKKKIIFPYVQGMEIDFANIDIDRALETLKYLRTYRNRVGKVSILFSYFDTREKWEKFKKEISFCKEVKVETDKLLSDDDSNMLNKQNYALSMMLEQFSGLENFSVETGVREYVI